MAVLDSCPKHNMVAYLEKTEGNAEFHEIIDFLKRSSIHHALTVSPVVSTTFVEQFWTSAKSKTINNVRHITAKVAGKSVSISEASIRSDLLFDDADGIDSLPNQTIFDAIQQMGSKSTSWDQIPTNIATAVICLTSNQKYNFSKLIFDGKQLASVSVPLDHFPVNILTSKVFSFMVKKGKHFSGKVTPLFATMLVQPTQDEGASSERPSEALPTPSPAPTSEVPHEPQNDSPPAQTSGHIKGTDEQVEGTEEQIVGSEENFEGTEENIEGTEEQVESTDGQRKGTEDQPEEEIVAQATQTPTQTHTSTVFGDDETIAKVLLNMSQAKAVSREKEKGVELKDIEEADRPRLLYKISPSGPLKPSIRLIQKTKEEEMMRKMN
ncbi:hypothetical protein Tco_0634719 [Tanacetum coccineum]